MGDTSILGSLPSLHLSFLRVASPIQKVSSSAAVGSGGALLSWSCPRAPLIPVPLGMGLLPGLAPPVLECMEKDHVEPDHV